MLDDIICCLIQFTCCWFGQYKPFLNKYIESGEITMNKFEKEYQEFMAKLADKVNEVQKDFDDLSPETQARVKSDAKYIAIMQLLGPQF